MKHKSWLNTDPLYILHIFLLIIFIMVINWITGLIGLSTLFGTFDTAMMLLANLVWYGVWAYLYDVSFHYWIGGD